MRKRTLSRETVLQYLYTLEGAFASLPTPQPPTDSPSDESEDLAPESPYNSVYGRKFAPEPKSDSPSPPIIPSSLPPEVTEPIHSTENLHNFLKHFNTKHGDLSYIEKLISGVMQHRKDYDELIRKQAKNWELSRILPVDRLAIYIGLFEIFNIEDVPYKVAINEAVNLAKRYSLAKSGKFVNGILDGIGKDNGLQ